jgi:ribonuclease G
MVENTEKELIINSEPTNVELALLENKRLVELHRQKTNNNFTVGDIFLGRIKRVMPGLNAAFVDIGHKRDAFLHYTDLGPRLPSLIKYTNDALNGKLDTSKLDNFKFPSDIHKNGKIDQVLKKKQLILLQILKEPISTKGPRMTCEITIPGRYVVLTPFSDGVAVSKKIGSKEERKRLELLVKSIKPKNFGAIIRTAAEGKKVADLHEEIRKMTARWHGVFTQLINKPNAPAKLMSELDKTSSILRDMLNDTFNSIQINDKELTDSVKDYLGKIAPDKVGIVKHYRSNKPIFDSFGITKQIKSSFGKTSTMPSGAYLVIEHTEAMHVIDVNSGHKLASSSTAQAALKVNMEAAEEIARQLRLRDIGGLIIIDFIDMRVADHRKMLFTSMKELMKKDTAQHTILPLSKFGLMQITRQRVKPEVVINTSEACPTCGGTGKVNATLLLADDVQRDLEYILKANPKKLITIEVHPIVHAYFTKGLPSIRWKWRMKYKTKIKFRENKDIGMIDYKFYDEKEDEIRLK